MGASSLNSSEWNIDDKWSSQEWKSGEMLGARTVRPVDDKFVIDAVVDSDTVTKPNLSLKSRSFLNRVNDRLRKILDHSSEDAMQDIDKRSRIWCMFMSSTLEASVFMVKILRKHMLEISELLIIEQSDDIFGVSQISWAGCPWRQLSLVTDEKSHQSLACKGLCIFRFCVMSWKGESEPSIKYCLGSAVELVLEFITIQNFGHNRW